MARWLFLASTTKNKTDLMTISDTISGYWGITKMLNVLKKRGYALELRREATCLYCLELEEWIMPENFRVDEYYYFQETSNPDADRMLYAIFLSQGRKGFLIDACTVYMDNISPEMSQKLNNVYQQQ